jgi:hypothetical protein
MRGIRIIPIVFVLCVSLSVRAQQDEPSRAPEAQEDIEEVVVIGERYRFQLRHQMIEAEEAAYDIFNKFNDEDRFDIVCNTQLATGTLIESERLHCQPNFEVEAIRDHARDYLDSLRLLYDPYSTDKNSPMVSPPAAAMIASQQGAYRRKLKQVAEEHPEFLEAIIRYSELKAQYEGTAE